MNLKQIILLLGLLAPVASHAATYSMEWSAINGSGGTASAGQYSVAATIGQTAAGGPMAAKKYDSTAGFWEVPGGPGLTIEFTAPNTIVISWPVPALGCFALEKTPSLNPPVVWVDVPATVTFAGGIDQVTVTLTGKMEYFRLVSPCQ